jgi:hypothetical protein
MLSVSDSKNEHSKWWAHTEVQINHDVPGSLAVVDGAAEAEDLTGQHPPDQANGVATLVVGRDGNIDVLGGRVGVAERNDGDVDVAGLLDGLGVGAGIGDNNQAGLLERAGDVVGEGTGGEAAGNGLGAGVGGELEDSTLAVGTGGDDANIARVVNGGNDTGGEDNLLPGCKVSGLLFCETNKRPTVTLKGSLSPANPTYQVLPMLMMFTPSARVFQR